MEETDKKKGIRRLPIQQISQDTLDVNNLEGLFILTSDQGPQNYCYVSQM